MREVNKIYCDDWLNNGLPDKCAKLIIMDCPYFEVKGDFDFIWKTFDDYLADVEKWAVECKRVLADNGTLFWYGAAKNIAYSQVIIDKHLNLLNSIVWENTNDHKQQIRFNEDLRTFAPITERILMYEKAGDKTGGELIFEQFLKPKNPFSKYLKSEFKKAKITNKKISKLFPSKTGGLTGCVSNWLNGDNVITECQYIKIKGFLENKYLLKPYDELKKEYDELKKEYEKLRRLFNNKFHYGDVIRLPNYQTSYHDHDTVKPEKLTRILIHTTTRKKDLVVIPMSGSGTECAMSAYEGRPFYGFDIKQKYVDMSNNRTAKIFKEPQLF